MHKLRFLLLLLIGIIYCPEQAESTSVTTWPDLNTRRQCLTYVGTKMLYWNSIQKAMLNCLEMSKFISQDSVVEQTLHTLQKMHSYILDESNPEDSCGLVCKGFDLFHHRINYYVRNYLKWHCCPLELTNFPGWNSESLDTQFITNKSKIIFGYTASSLAPDNDEFDEVLHDVGCFLSYLSFSFEGIKQAKKIRNSDHGVKTVTNIMILRAFLAGFNPSQISRKTEALWFDFFSQFLSLFRVGDIDLAVLEPFEKMLLNWADQSKSLFEKFKVSLSRMKGYIKTDKIKVQDEKPFRCNLIDLCWHLNLKKINFMTPIGIDEQKHNCPNSAASSHLSKKDLYELIERQKDYWQAFAIPKENPKSLGASFAVYKCLIKQIMRTFNDIQETLKFLSDDSCLLIWQGLELLSHSLNYCIRAQIMHLWKLSPDNLPIWKSPSLGNDFFASKVHKIMHSNTGKYNQYLLSFLQNSLRWISHCMMVCQEGFVIKQNNNYQQLTQLMILRAFAACFQIDHFGRDGKAAWTNYITKILNSFNRDILNDPDLILVPYQHLIEKLLEATLDQKAFGCFRNNLKYFANDSVLDEMTIPATREHHLSLINLCINLLPANKQNRSISRSENNVYRPTKLNSQFDCVAAASASYSPIQTDPNSFEQCELLTPSPEFSNGCAALSSPSYCHQPWGVEFFQPACAQAAATNSAIHSYDFKEQIRILINFYQNLKDELNNRILAKQINYRAIGSNQEHLLNPEYRVIDQLWLLVTDHWFRLSSYLKPEFTEQYLFTEKDQVLHFLPQGLLSKLKLFVDAMEAGINEEQSTFYNKYVCVHLFLGFCLPLMQASLEKMHDQPECARDLSLEIYNKIIEDKIAEKLQSIEHKGLTVNIYKELCGEQPNLFFLADMVSDLFVALIEGCNNLLNQTFSDSENKKKVFTQILTELDLYCAGSGLEPEDIHKHFVVDASEELYTVRDPESFLLPSRFKFHPQMRMVFSKLDKFLISMEANNIDLEIQTSLLHDVILPLFIQSINDVKNNDVSTWPLWCQQFEQIFLDHLQQVYEQLCPQEQSHLQGKCALFCQVVEQSGLLPRLTNQFDELNIPVDPEPGLSANQLFVQQNLLRICAKPTSPFLIEDEKTLMEVDNQRRGFDSYSEVSVEECQANDLLFHSYDLREQVANLLSFYQHWLKKLTCQSSNIQVDYKALLNNSEPAINAIWHKIISYIGAPQLSNYAGFALNEAFIRQYLISSKRFNLDEINSRYPDCMDLLAEIRHMVAKMDLGLSGVDSSFNNKYICVYIFLHLCLPALIESLEYYLHLPLNDTNESLHLYHDYLVNCLEAKLLVMKSNPDLQNLGRELTGIDFHLPKVVRSVAKSIQDYYSGFRDQLKSYLGPELDPTLKPVPNRSLSADLELINRLHLLCQNPDLLPGEAVAKLGHAKSLVGPLEKLLHGCPISFHPQAKTIFRQMNKFLTAMNERRIIANEQLVLLYVFILPIFIETLEQMQALTSFDSWQAWQCIFNQKFGLQVVKSFCEVQSNLPKPHKLASRNQIWALHFRNVMESYQSLPN